VVARCAWRTTILAVATALSVTACWGGRARYLPRSTEESDAAVDADADGDADGDATLDAEAEPDGTVEAGPDGDADQVPTAHRGGVVVLEERDTGDGAVESSARVWFRFRRSMAWCGYQFEFYGDCTLLAVSRPSCDPVCGDGLFCQWNDACTVAECAPDPAPLFDAYECDLDGEADFWHSADEITVSAPGASMPSFSATVTAPPPIAVTTDMTGWTAETFDGTRALTLEWDATSTATAVQISVSGDDDTLSCLAADEGSFIISAEALAALDDPGEVTLTVLRSNAAIANEAHDGEVKVYAESIGLIWISP